MFEARAEEEGGGVNPVIIGNAELYLGDCLEILPTLPKVDAVITDPPYDDYTHANAKTNKTVAGHVFVGHENPIKFGSITGDEFVGLAVSLCEAANRWVVMTCSHQHAARMFGAKEFVRLGAWVKTNPMPQISGDRPAQGHEAVLICHRPGKKRWNGGGRAAVWRESACVAGHMAERDRTPTQKPVALAEAFCRDFTDAEETILDPFMGSGTTGVACMNLGRKFIGIEIEPKYFDIACRRIEDAQRQGRLFA